MLENGQTVYLGFKQRQAVICMRTKLLSIRPLKERLVIVIWGVPDPAHDADQAGLIEFVTRIALRAEVGPSGPAAGYCRSAATGSTRDARRAGR